LLGNFDVEKKNFKFRGLKA
jgi:hypothetical protein